MALIYDRHSLRHESKATQVSLPCPTCGAAIATDLSELYPGATVRCGSCNEEHNLKGEDMREVAREILDLDKSTRDVLK